MSRTFGKPSQNKSLGVLKMDLRHDKMEITSSWRALTDKIVQKFIEEYFYIGCIFDFNWVGDDYVVFHINDYYFNFSDAIFCLENNVSEKKLFEWYNKRVDEELNISLKDFLESPEKLKQRQEEYLKELKQRVKTAEEEFNKAIESYRDRINI